MLTSLGSSATVTYNNGTDLASAAALAAASDVAIVMVGDISAEGVDRSTLMLPTVDNVDQNALVNAVAAANPKTIVVLKDGGPVLMPWLNQVPALLEAWYPGEEDGNVVAELLFGVANPSGKLPITFPTLEREAATSTVQQWPGVTVNGVLTATYAEGLEIGYRWYDANNVQPQFPFGYGLSYTTFSVSDLEVNPRNTNGKRPIVVEFTVKNTGTVRGAEAPQVYFGLPASSGEPPKRLVAFEKVWLNPGEQRRVQLIVDPDANSHPLGHWRPGAQKWGTIRGDITVYVGTSAADLSLSRSITVSRGD